VAAEPSMSVSLVRWSCQALEVVGIGYDVIPVFLFPVRFWSFIGYQDTSTMRFQYYQSFTNITPSHYP
jgi:hypothetical protein